MRRFVLCLSLTIAGCAGTLDDPDRFARQTANSNTPGAVGPSPEAGSSDPWADASGDGGASSCPDMEKDVLPGKCAMSGCHAATNPSNALDLQTPGVYARYANKSAVGG